MQNSYCKESVKGFIECVNGIWHAYQSKLHNAQYYLFVHSPWVLKQITINLLKTGKSRILNVSSTHKFWCHCIDLWCRLGYRGIGLYNLLICCVVGYTDSCAMLNIPGFTFPVRQFLLEDVLELLQSVLALNMFIDTAHSVFLRLSVPFTCCSSMWQVCCCGSGRQEINQSWRLLRTAAAWRSTANASSVMFTAKGCGWTQTC